MKPNRIILVRHGESQGNVARSNYETIPDYALDLTDNGRAQSVTAGKEIIKIIQNESVHAYISPYSRTRQTFEGIKSTVGNNIVKTIEDPRLREQDWGHLRHPDANKEIIRERKTFGKFFYRIKDGESGADVFDRISTFLETLHRDFQKPDYPKNCLVVTHGLTLRLFLMRWFHWPVEEFEKLRNPANCQIVILDKRKNDKYELISTLVKREETKNKTEPDHRDSKE